MMLLLPPCGVRVDAECAQRIARDPARPAVALNVEYLLQRLYGPPKMRVGAATIRQLPGALAGRAVPPAVLSRVRGLKRAGAHAARAVVTRNNGHSVNPALRGRGVGPRGTGPRGRGTRSTRPAWVACPRGG